MPEEKSKILLLFKDIHAGKQQAFDALFLLYYDRLVGFALQYIDDRESAEEITSSLFVKLWIKRENLLTVLKPEVYLFVAIKNACLNLIRSESKSTQLTVQMSDNEVINQIASQHEQLMEHKELGQLISAAIAALPEQRRIIFKLMKEDGLKSAMVATILGISVRTVENQLYKAVKSIAASISSYLGYDPQRKITRKQALSTTPLIFFL